ncbi:hypothetical protein GGX14DRAFT_404916 [Mycena pura]|uniref:Uncharacterized protein n=1 Tax=Mycena pura TaxID=153505 RepID=A0AAD6UTK1_9AGAR|nr:hypothetical protein GGX14DRAFT_404916 [Mycena pura]
MFETSGLMGTSHRSLPPVDVLRRRAPETHLRRCKSCTADGREVECPGLPVIAARGCAALRRARRHVRRGAEAAAVPPRCGATDIDRRRRPVRYLVADPAQPTSASEPPLPSAPFSLASNSTHRSRAPRSTCADPDSQPMQHLSPTRRRHSIHSLHDSVIVILLSRPAPTPKGQAGAHPRTVAAQWYIGYPRFPM